jgi:hypothetical protein
MYQRFNGIVTQVYDDPEKFKMGVNSAKKSNAVDWYAFSYDPMTGDVKLIESNKKTDN